MGGTLDREEHNIGGRVTFILEPGLIQNEELVSNV